MVSQLNPQRSVLLGFVTAIVVGTFLLLLPVAHRDPSSNSLIDNLFTAVSATCVTGLATVDTVAYWSPFGQVVVLLLIQVGGLGLMTLSTAIGVFLVGRLSLNTKLKTSAEVRGNGLFDMKRMVLRVIKISLSIEFLGFLFLAGRFYFGYNLSLGESLWRGIFHAVSGFNNAGFALYSNNLIGFYNDPWILLPISFLIILGGLGFPVIVELRKCGKHIRWWSMGTKLVLTSTVLLSYWELSSSPPWNGTMLALWDP